MKRVLPILLLATLASAAEVHQTLTEAYDSFLQGRQHDSVAGYRYLATLGISAPDPDTNLAILERDSGMLAEALPLWLKSSLREAADGFVWNQRGWAYTALDRPKEARESFLKAVDRSSTTAMQAEANLGLGVAALLSGQPKTALAPLRSALVAGRYIIPLAAYYTAQASILTRDKNAAVAYYRQCANLDPLNLECLRGLAELQDKAGDNRAAWRAWRRLLSLDPADAQAAERVKKLQAYLPTKVEELLPVRRLSRPLLSAASEDLPEPKTKTTLRVALYSGADARAGTMTRVYVMANTDFKLIAANGEVVRDSGRGHDQWEILFREDTNIVEVRDNARNIQHTSRQPFKIVPSAPTTRGSVLLKSAVLTHPEGIDGGDREVRGGIEIIPNPYGFKVVNELNLEEYVYGAISASLPEGSPLEAYRAQAVISRTFALWSKENNRENLEKSHVCDSPACARYVGLSEELRDPVKAAAETEGWILSSNGVAARAPQHDHCGGLTEEENGLPGVQDSELPGIPHRTPEQLERYTHEFPPRDRFCEAGSLAPGAQSRWLRMLRSDDLRERLDRKTSVGAVRHLRVARRSPTGRVLAVEITGSRGAVTLEGREKIEEILSPGSLRSTLFTIQPLPKAGGFLLFGAGTGHGVGFCKAGAIGQAALGRDWKTVLKHYFPTLTLKDLAEKPKETKKAPASAPGKYRHKNPRKKKP
jgi:stage II sporulation protein D